MKKEIENAASVILAAACALAATALFRGFSPSCLAFIPLAVAAGYSTGTVLFPLLVILLSGGLLAPDMIPWAALAGGMICSVSGKVPVARVSGFLAVAVSMWFVPLEASTIPLVVSASGAFFYRKKHIGYILLAAGVVFSAFTTGLPHSPVNPSAVAESYTENGEIRYSIPVLNGALREVLIPAPVSGEWVMWLAYEGGGVRDTMPLAVISLREEIVILPADPESLCFTVFPGDTLRVSLVRNCHPFNHPVIHVTAGGELL